MTGPSPSDALTLRRLALKPPERENPKLHVFPEAPIQKGDDMEYSAILEIPGLFREKLWYRVPLEFSGFVDQESSDPFVVGSFFLAMAKNTDLVVHGQVSPSLLRNLIDFQNAWTCWLPAKFNRIDVKADLEKERAPSGDPGSAICLFSGGVDSAFTIYRHTSVIKDRQKRNIASALLVHGFDIPLEDTEAFARASRKCRETLKSLDLVLTTMSTNYRQLEFTQQDVHLNWDHTHGAGVASCLLLFQNRFTEGIIPSTYPLTQLYLPWGSNPITDCYLGSDSFKIVHDAPHWTRFSKVLALANWPKAYDNLRVCFSAPRKDENCCRCIKCITTILVFRMADLPMPASFPHEVSEEDILALHDLTEQQVFGLDAMVKFMRTSELPTSLVDAFESRVVGNKASPPVTSEISASILTVPKQAILAACSRARTALSRLKRRFDH